MISIRFSTIGSQSRGSSSLLLTVTVLYAIYFCLLPIHCNIPPLTDWFLDLELGELLHDQLFGLFEAMSAIEMMDPKMDAGMICNRGNKRALSFDQALEVRTFTFEKM